MLFGGSEILNLLCCLGIRNSESSPLLFGGSEILNPLLCCLGDQKFWLRLLCCLGGQKLWLLAFVVWGIRNSESSPVLFGASEILNPLLCCLGDQKFRLLSSVVWGVRNSDSSPLLFGRPNKVEIKNRKLLGRILRFLANRETFIVSFNTSFRLRVNCKNHLWN